MYSAESQDAQFGPQDARLWDWVAFGVIATIINGFAVWGIRDSHPDELPTAVRRAVVAAEAQLLRHPK